MDDTGDTRQLRLDHRHLAFFFLGAVAVCAIFFALGFVVGRGQTYEAAMKEPSSGAKAPEPKSLTNSSQASLEESGENAKLTATDRIKPEGKRDQETDYRHELDFYNTLDQKPADENFHLTGRKAERKLASAERAKSKTPAAMRTALRVPSGNLVSLQVGAFSNASDADKLAKTLRSKGYSVSLVNPGRGNGDKFVRIHIGPFTHLEEAHKVQAQLEKDGYEAIIKH
jgi:cell division protein FtsN